MNNEEKRVNGEHIPGATCRLQFHEKFRFADATEILEYLAALGITDVYASPIFTAGPGSTHGYDICAFCEVNPALGNAADFRRFTEARKSLGLGLLLDMVPNHMGTSPANPWWMDVLKHGPASKFAHHFDINWHDPKLPGRILLPMLGDHYHRVLERGELSLIFENGEFQITCYDQRFPLAPQTRRELHNAAARSDVKSVLEGFNGPDPDARQRLHQLLQQQYYRLAYWRLGPQEINYRRFFDVTTLIGLRVEDQKVFLDAHSFLFDLIKDDTISALRIDHPDGLLDPKTYFDRLQRFASDRGLPRIYVVAEKILSDDERLPADWAVDGTTGYDFLNYLNGVFVDEDSAELFSETYTKITGCSDRFDRVALESKRFVLRLMFSAEVDTLADRLKSIATRTRNGQDFSRNELKQALGELLACFPVYRTYARGTCAAAGSPEQLVPPEAQPVREALERAVKERPHLVEAAQFVASILLLEDIEAAAPPLLSDTCAFIARFQQLSGPATAKGLEDTAFYRFNRFISLNEVGGNPGTFGRSATEFHGYNRHKRAKWPHSLLATATHDTKRGEDVRARLNVLSEMPGAWECAVLEWMEVNKPHKTVLASRPAPDANDEYLLYQTLIGSWDASPAYSERIKAYMQKAMREAKVNTSWTDPNEEYERAMFSFIERMLSSWDFIRSFRPLQQRVALFGVFNSLAQVLLKIASPGVPDFYQGSELWDLSLVDPDNRRPVDYGTRKQLLARISSVSISPEFLEALLSEPENGAVKLFTIWKALQTRRSHRSLFEQGDYSPVNVKGSKQRHVIAFRRTAGNLSLIAVVPRFCSLLVPDSSSVRNPAECLRAFQWGDTELEQNTEGCRNVFTGGTARSARLDHLLSAFPVALLVQEKK